MAKITSINQRNNEIDAVRGMAIVLVVIGHIIQYQNPTSYNSDLTFRVIYSFHMPLFYFVSGVVTSIYSKAADKNLHLFMKRTWGLLYPWGVWTLIVFTFFYIRDPISFPFAKAIAFYWFLPVLYVCHIILFFLTATHNNKEKIFHNIFPLSAILLLLVLLSNDFWISSIRFHAVYFAAGYIIAKNYGRTFERDSKRLLLPALLFLISLFLWYIAFDIARSENDILKYLKFLSRALAALFGIITTWFAVTILPKKLKCILIYIGKYSLQIYLIHLFIIQFIVFSPIRYSIGLWLVLLLSMSIMISTILKRIGFSAVLFGR